jgi:hypothetical protein
MSDEAIRELMVLARAAHGWSKWRNEAERNGDFARSPEVDMLAIAAENALAAIARLSAVDTNSPSTTARLSIDANDLVALCASCKQVRAEDGSWTSIEGYLQDAHQKWVTHSLELCAADAQSALHAPSE